MRFILNFIFFGILFYVIHLFFPEAFFTMVEWANKVYEFLRDVFLQLSSKIQDWRGQRETQSLLPQHVLLLIPLWIMTILKKKV